MVTRQVLEITALVGLAAAIHFGLRRLGHRLPIVIARRRGIRRAPTWVRSLPLVLQIAKAALWIAAAWGVTQQLAGIRAVRDDAVATASSFLAEPLLLLADHCYSSLELLELPAYLLGAWLGVRVGTALFKRHVLAAAGVERGIQEAVTMLLRYTLIAASTFIILRSFGVDVSSLAVAAGVLGVGIGFGLQNIANNFVSGLLVNLERPVQIGDFIRVGEWTGTVERIGPRCIEIRTLDRVSILVPNAKFLETEVVNWSHGDPTTRVHVPVGVAYGSDVRLVRRALLEAAKGHPDVLSEPRPEVDLNAFGPSSLDFELQVWIRTPRKQDNVRSDLFFRVEASLRRHGIEIPFPQRELHLRSPKLERIVDALASRWAPEALGNGESADAPAASTSFAAEDEDDVPGETWSDVRLEALAERIRSDDGVEICDRRHLLTVYRDCFVGREAVDWLATNLRLSRDEAVELGQRLVDKGFVHHVLGEHGFEDGRLFYQFTGGAPPLSSTRQSRTEPPHPARSRSAARFARGGL
ncbi:MAG: mechanosensitive ion channel [Deltaproteobacteria bacterium]|nr:mechanosensitive ion channel [Deltaproteobacteria bacterium]